MTTETIHTCSYECERPECIRAQRDELAARLTAAQPMQQGGGEINMDVTVRDGAWVGTYAEWCRRKQDAPPSAPVGVDAPGSRAWMAEVCRAAALSLAAHGVRNDQLSKVADWITQQPAAVAVDEAMVERACKAALDEVWPDTYEDADDLRAMIRRILSAALAAQHQEPTT